MCNTIYTTYVHTGIISNYYEFRLVIYSLQVPTHYIIIVVFYFFNNKKVPYSTSFIDV